MFRPKVFCVYGVAFVLAAMSGFAMRAAAQEEEPIRVLLVTGEDYKGHLWKETSPVIRQALEADGDLEARIVDDVEFLASDVVFDYDVIFLHLKNYSPPRREEAVHANLTKFVEQGGGLVLFHFACGAFEEWPGFVRLAGRVWNPELRGHDPRGPFTVNIADTEHPVTASIADFETHDELYTCLGESDIPIHVLASATSKVDKKTYPIAFVFTRGKGRVYHNVLGHDVQALQPPEVGQLLRQGCRWVARAESP